MEVETGNISVILSSISNNSNSNENQNKVQLKWSLYSVHRLDSGRRMEGVN